MKRYPTTAFGRDLQTGSASTSPARSDPEGWDEVKDTQGHTPLHGVMGNNDMLRVICAFLGFADLAHMNGVCRFYKLVVHQISGSRVFESARNLLQIPKHVQNIYTDLKFLTPTKQPLLWKNPPRNLHVTGYPPKTATGKAIFEPKGANTLAGTHLVLCQGTHQVKWMLPRLTSKGLFRAVSMIVFEGCSWRESFRSLGEDALVPIAKEARVRLVLSRSSISHDMSIYIIPRLLRALRAYETVKIEVNIMDVKEVFLPWKRHETEVLRKAEGLFEGLPGTSRPKDLKISVGPSLWSYSSSLPHTNFIRCKPLPEKRGTPMLQQFPFSNNSDLLKQTMERYGTKGITSDVLKGLADDEYELDIKGLTKTSQFKEGATGYIDLKKITTAVVNLDSAQASILNFGVLAVLPNLRKLIIDCSDKLTWCLVTDFLLFLIQKGRVVDLLVLKFDHYDVLKDVTTLLLLQSSQNRLFKSLELHLRHDKGGVGSFLPEDVLTANSRRVEELSYAPLLPSSQSLETSPTLSPSSSHSTRSFGLLRTLVEESREQKEPSMPPLSSGGSLKRQELSSLSSSSLSSSSTQSSCCLLYTSPSPRD